MNITRIYLFVPIFLYFIFISPYVIGNSVSEYFPNSYAIVIGIQEYRNKNWNELKEVENNVKGVSRFFESEGFSVKTFLNQQATRNNVITYLKDELSEIVENEDRIVIYFSGHGDSFKNTQPGYLIPYDGVEGKRSSWISKETLVEWSNYNHAKQILFIIDACVSGWGEIKSANDRLGYADGGTPRVARQVLSACKTGQSALSVNTLKNYEQYSYYTAYLLKGLRGGYADVHRDGIISFGELSAYLRVAAATSISTPYSGHLTGHDNGSFVFSSPLPILNEHNNIRTFYKAEKKASLDYSDDEQSWLYFSEYGVDGLEKYLSKYPNGKYSEEASSRLKQIRELGTSEQVGNFESPVRWPQSRLTPKEKAESIGLWIQDIQYSTDPKVIEQYLSLYPGGPMSSKAEKRLRQLKEKK